MAVGGAQHSGVIGLASRCGNAAFWRQRSRTGCGCGLRGGALCAAGRGASSRAAVHRIPRLDAIAAHWLPRFRDLAALSRRNHHAPCARCVSSGAQFSPHDRDPRVSRHDLVRCLPNQRFGGVQRHPVARWQPETVDRPQRALLRLRRQFLAARPVFRLVRPLAEGRAERTNRPAGGLLLAARLGRGPRRLRPWRIWRLWLSSWRCFHA